MSFITSELRKAFNYFVVTKINLDCLFATLQTFQQQQQALAQSYSALMAQGGKDSGVAVTKCGGNPLRTGLLLVALLLIQPLFPARATDGANSIHFGLNMPMPFMLATT